MTAPAYDGGWTDVPLPLDPPDGGGWDAVELDDTTADGEDLERFLPAVLAEDVGLAVEDWRDPTVARTFAADLRGRLLDNLREQYATIRAARPDGRVVEATLAPELSFCTSATVALDALTDALKAGSAEARAIAGEVLLDLPKTADERKTATVKTADVYGPLVVKRTQATKVSARAEEVVDVVVASLVGGLGAGSPHAPQAYAEGARQGIAGILSLTAAPTWKTTALDALAGQLEEGGEHDLAIRLGHAYGRVPQGEPKVTLERPEP